MTLKVQNNAARKETDVKCISVRNVPSTRSFPAFNQKVALLTTTLRAKPGEDTYETGTPGMPR